MGYRKFKLSILNLLPMIVIPILVVNQFILSGYLISSILYCGTHVLLHNIRIYDYIQNNVKTSTYRALIISFFKLVFWIYLLFRTKY